MSNPTLEYVKLDAASFMAALASVKPANVAMDPDSSMENHNRARTYVVANYASQAGQSIIHSDYYSLALLALAQSGGLVLAAPPERGYEMGVMFRDGEEDEKSELAPLPPSPGDPWERQSAKEEADRIQDAFFDACGRPLSPAEQIIAARYVTLGKPGDLDEMEEVGREIPGVGWRIDHAKTQAKRAENRQKNAERRKKK